MKLSLLPIAFLQLASAQITVDTTVLQPGPLLDNNGPLTGGRKCALVNVAMDESSSMTTEQTFMRDEAIPGMIQKLKGPDFNYDHVFVCSNGFGFDIESEVPARRDLQANPLDHYRHLGCTVGNADGTGNTPGTLEDPSITNWIASGIWEEGYHAMIYSIANVNQTIGGINLQTDCASLAKNIILVTDEVSISNLQFFLSKLSN